MKRKIAGEVVCALLVLSMVPVAKVTYESPQEYAMDSEIICISISSGSPDETTAFPYTVVEENEHYVRLLLDNSSTFLKEPGKPLIPTVVKHFELPFGITNVRVNVDVPSYRQHILPKDIVPASNPVPYTLSRNGATGGYTRNEQIYGSSQPYPSRWFSYHAGCGLNDNLQRVTHLTVELYPIRYCPADHTIMVAESAAINISYDEPASPFFTASDTYDLVIISPSVFSAELERLVDHKNAHGVQTLLKTTEEIYAEYDGVDRPEKIKHFIKDAIETWNVTYVLLVGGLKSPFYGNPRDTSNYGSRNWYVPVRYSNLYDIYEDDPVYDPGFLCDLYFSDIYKAGGVFDDWDSNDDGIIGARNRPETPDDTLDLYPDVYVGRLPCRSIREVQSCVDKIITYENTAAGSEWFRRIVAVAGDGLQDQEDLDVQWDVTGLPSGEYTIYAQSRSNITGEWGPVDEVTVTVDPAQESSLHFSEDDHLRIHTYPGPAILEITSPSTGDILGSTDVDFTPPEAYMGFLWANVTYVDGIMHIRGKSYDPRPYGFYTDIKVWIENEEGETVFTQQKKDIRSFCDCEWTTGERPMGGGRAGAFYYMPDTFEKIYLWASNGNFTSQSDVIRTLSEGCGFAFFFGHASPSTMIVNMPGMPGGFSKSAVIGLQPINIGIPVFPMNSIENTDKLPIVAVMGCHNSQFNVTLLNSVLGWNRVWTGFYPTPECWSWWLTKVPRSGAIATIGCTGLGPGSFNQEFVPDTGCWIFPEFFRQYGEEGHHVLGDAHGQSITSYLSTFGQSNMIDVKMVQEFTLFGDPSLKIGGYP